MADIFNVEPPIWLQNLTHSDSKGLLGRAAGELLAGGIVAGEHAIEPDQQRNWFQLLPQSIAEAKMSMLDPMWRIKLQQTQLGIAQNALQLRETQQNIDLNATKLKLNAEDISNIPKWLQDHPTVESRMDAEWPAAMTPEWNNNLNQLRLRDSQSSLAKVTITGLKELSDTINEISVYDGVKAGELSAKIQPYAIKGQMPPPELTAQVMEARSGAETKKFERTKELYGIKGIGQPVAQKYLRLADQEDELAEDFRTKGDVAGYQEHHGRAENYRALAAPKTSTTEVTTTPGGGTTVTQTYGPKPTGAMTTEAQKKIVRYEDALTLINQLQKTLQPTDVGPAGVAGEMILDVALPAFGQNQFYSGARIQNRTALGALRESLLRQISDDPRFSNVDRETVSNLLPKTGVFESYPAAMDRMAQVKQILTDRIQSYSGASRTPTPASAKAPADLINEYNTAVDKLSAEVKASRLTPDQAYQQAQDLHKRLTESLQRFH